MESDTLRRFLERFSPECRQRVSALLADPLGSPVLLAPPPVVRSFRVDSLAGLELIAREVRRVKLTSRPPARIGWLVANDRGEGLDAAEVEAVLGAHACLELLEQVDAGGIESRILAIGRLREDLIGIWAAIPDGSRPSSGSVSRALNALLETGLPVTAVAVSGPTAAAWYAEPQARATKALRLLLAGRSASLALRVPAKRAQAALAEEIAAVTRLAAGAPVLWVAFEDGIPEDPGLLELLVRSGIVADASVRPWFTTSGRGWALTEHPPTLPNRSTCAPPRLTCTRESWRRRVPLGERRPVRLAESWLGPPRALRPEWRGGLRPAAATCARLWPDAGLPRRDGELRRAGPALCPLPCVQLAAPGPGPPDHPDRHRRIPDRPSAARDPPSERLRTRTPPGVSRGAASSRAVEFLEAARAEAARPHRAHRPRRPRGAACARIPTCRPAARQTSRCGPTSGTSPPRCPPRSAARSRSASGRGQLARQLRARSSSTSAATRRLRSCRTHRAPGASPIFTSCRSEPGASTPSLPTTSSNMPTIPSPPARDPSRPAPRRPAARLHPAGWALNPAHEIRTHLWKADRRSSSRRPAPPGLRLVDLGGASISTLWASPAAFPTCDGKVGRFVATRERDVRRRQPDVRHRRGVPPRRAPVSERAGAVARWRDRMPHRGPDGVGLWCAADRQLHARRTAGCRSSTCRTPRRSRWPTPTARSRSTFNGEIYNHAELRTELEALGKYALAAPTTPTPKCCCTPTRSGASTASTGSTACSPFAIYDARDPRPAGAASGPRPRRHQAAVLHADRAAASGCSRPRSARSAAHPDVTPEMDRTAFWHYLTFIVAPAPLTMFRGIFKLPAGHRSTIDHAGRRERDGSGGTARPTRVDAADRADISEPEAVAELTRLLQAVDRAAHGVRRAVRRAAVGRRRFVAERRADERADGRGR